MPDEEDDSSVDDSMCATCKHGICLKDNDTQQFFQPGGKPEENAFDPQPPSQEDMFTEMQFPIKKIRSVCFWRPAKMNAASAMAPVVFSVVKECSRYEEDD